MPFFFSVPILLALVLGYYFPYSGLELIPFCFIFLFGLLIIASATIKWEKVSAFALPWRQIGLFLVVHYFVFPLTSLTLANALLTDQQFVTGVFAASLTPVAIVAPFFVRIAKGAETLSYSLLIITSLLSPVVLPLMLKLFSSSFLEISIETLAFYVLVLNFVPLVLGFGIAKFMNRLQGFIFKHSSTLNMIFLSALIFSMTSSASGRWPIHQLEWLVVIKILGLFLFQDFGVLFISMFLLSDRLESHNSSSYSISLAMKNIAIAAGVLLFYDPKATFPVILGFIVHAFLFNSIVFLKPLIFQTKIKESIA